MLNITHMPKNKTALLPPGVKYNRLTVIDFHHQDKRWRRFYTWRCDCGNEIILQVSAVTSGNTKSCGCYNKEIRKTLNKLPGNLGVIRQIILGYKRHAKDRGFEWELTEDDVIRLISQDCHYCGLPPSNKKITKNHSGFLYSGIDRVNSAKDYTTDNCVPCCEQCNKAKMALSKEEFIAWVKRVYKKAMAEQWSNLL